MAALDSEEVKRILLSKLGCEPDNKRDHFWFVLKDEDGTLLARTCISHGPRHDIGPKLVTKMARQLKLQTAGLLIELVACTKTKEECLAVIRSAV